VAPIRTIIFDLGKVVIDFDHSIAARKIALLAGKTPSEIHELFFDSSLIQSFEQGTISPQAFFVCVQQRIDLDIPFEQFVLIWNNIFYLTSENKAVYEMMKKLSPRYTLAMLSNINELHYAYLKAAVPVFDRFQYLFASCEMGVTKPDPRIYKKALVVLGAEPEQVFYTDDRPEMVAAACALGIKGFVYTGSVQLKNDLALCGVSIEA
jgi:glucose-1-phosphatase